MKLLGANNFIKMPTGTFYVQYWLDTQKECMEIVREFLKSPDEFLKNRIFDLEVFGGNSGSMMFDDSEEDYVFYYDANVVGDASPSTTLYLVIEEDELPDEIVFNGNSGRFKLSKKEVIDIKNYFVENAHEHYEDNWAIKELDKLSKSGNTIVDINILG